MRVRITMASVVLLAVCALAYAQAATGTWTGEVQGRGGGGAEMVRLVLNANGTGTFKQGGQDEEQLSEVMLDGPMVSFKRMPNFGGRGGFTLSYSGEVDGDMLTLNIAFEGGGPGGGGGGGGRGGFQIPPLVLTRQ